jgi:hypothetical protein
MKYYLWEEQDGGCDYSIGCGIRITEIEGAKDLGDAIRIACGVNPPPGEDIECDAMIATMGEFAVSSARVLTVADVHEIDLVALRAEREAMLEKAKQAEREEKERKELARLKKKYG